MSPCNAGPRQSSSASGNGLGRGTGIARPQCTTRLSEQLLESQRVDGRVGQRVSVGRRDDRVRPECSAKTSDVVLDGVARRGRQVVFPQRVDQRVDADDATAAKRKQRKQALALAAAHVRRPSAGENLERAEKPDFQRVDHAGRDGLHAQSRTLDVQVGRRARRAAVLVATPHDARLTSDEAAAANQPRASRGSGRPQRGSRGSRPRDARSDPTRKETG